MNYPLSEAVYLTMVQSWLWDSQLIYKKHTEGTEFSWKSNFAIVQFSHETNSLLVCPQNKNFKSFPVILQSQKQDSGRFETNNDQTKDFSSPLFSSDNLLDASKNFSLKV